MQHVLSVAGQVSILFIIMGCGFLAAKLGWATQNGARQMTNIVLYLATPCVILQSFMTVQPSAEVFGGMAGAAVFATVCHLLGILLGGILFRREPSARRNVFCMSASFPNCGFMGIPLVSALLGPEMVLYVSVFLIVFQLVVWTYGVWLHQPREKGSRVTGPAKMFINAGTVTLAAGLVLMALRIELPALIAQPIRLIGGLNSPLAMIVMGVYLANASFLPRRGDGKLWLAIGLRLLVIPALLLPARLLFSQPTDWMAVCLILSAAPPAANVLMFTAHWNGDAPLAARAVMYGSVASVVTMPVVIGLGMLL